MQDPHAAGRENLQSFWVTDVQVALLAGPVPRNAGAHAAGE